MDALVDTVIEDDRWTAVMLDTLANRAAIATLTALRLPEAGFGIVVMGCDDTRIATLNADFRGKPVPTNVLSWPSEERGAVRPGEMPEHPESGPQDDPAELGDIALAWETCVREAEEQGKSVPDHVTHLLVHGTLHLLGFDHQTDEDATLMEGIESRILATLGVSDPY